MAKINTTAFSRLRWAIFEDPSTIRVADDALSLTRELTPYSRRHAVALEAAFSPPVKEVYLTMLVDGEYEGWDEEPEEDVERPATAWHEVAVRREDGEGLLVCDAVEQLYEYFRKQKAWILEALIPLYNIEQGLIIDTPCPQETRVFFQGFASYVEMGDVPVCIAVWLEGQDELSVEQFWQDRYQYHSS